MISTCSMEGARGRAFAGTKHLTRQLLICLVACLAGPSLAIAAEPAAPAAGQSTPREVPAQNEIPFIMRPWLVYPEAAKAEGLTGRTVVRVQYSVSGYLEKVSIYKSSGHPVLDNAAVNAVVGSRIRSFAYEVDGIPRPLSTEIAFDFTPPPQQQVLPARAQTDKTTDSVVYLRAPRPRYPREARSAGLEGRVVLRVIIDAEGRVARINVERSSGHRILDVEAARAVMEARFRPYLDDGKAIPVIATIPINFGLD